MATEYQCRSRPRNLAIGGIAEGIDAAAQMAVIGLDPLRFLYTRSSFERQLLGRLAERIKFYHDIERRNLAVEIANQVGKLFKAN